MGVIGLGTPYCHFEPGSLTRGWPRISFGWPLNSSHPAGWPHLRRLLSKKVYLYSSCQLCNNESPGAALRCAGQTQSQLDRVISSILDLLTA